jgi:uncharacterized membrane protein YphA (DoxX/SURF4 family)
MEREGNDLPLLIGRLLMASLFLVAGIPKVLQGYGGPFAQYLAKLGFEVPPVSWTPEHLCSRSPRWQERTHLTRRSSGVR